MATGLPRISRCPAGPVRAGCHRVESLKMMYKLKSASYVSLTNYLHTPPPHGAFTSHNLIHTHESTGMAAV